MRIVYNALYKEVFKMAKAIDVARFFINIVNALPTDDLMTNLRVNKLLYFAQGECLKKLGHPLFTDDIEAWKYGPVVPSVYEQYKSLEKNPIQESIPYSKGAFSEEERELLFDVASYYGQISSSALVEMSHQKGSPWQQVYDPDRKHVKIDIDSIYSYFSQQNPIPTFSEVINKIETVGRRDDEGYLVLPAEWNDDE
ncbi:hypothetical protein HMPREF0080_02037 [Anaeroglobus geminatus F0357]|uniref:Antitoxin SocA-like Panacea domain-containing protein n=2 Tax=Anaeroglobus TaxID=156454 RepID=G9YK28_9FIRM|nr:hypothetical protein HMPREF0080_02037 [Anaeroglobus geminatus F0357]